MNEDTCTCEPGEYPDILCPEHEGFASPVTLFTAARYAPRTEQDRRNAEWEEGKARKDVQPLERR